MILGVRGCHSWSFASVKSTKTSCLPNFSALNMILMTSSLTHCIFSCLCVSWQLLEVRMQYELNDIESPDGGGGGEQTSAHPTPGASPQTSGPPSHPSTSSNNSDGGNIPCLKYETHTQKHLGELLKAIGAHILIHTRDLVFCLKHPCPDLVRA